MEADEYLSAMMEMTDVDTIEDTDENIERISMTILSVAIQMDWEYYIENGIVMVYC